MGQVNYEAYRARLHGEAATLRSPLWEDLTPEAREGFAAGAEAVITAHTKGLIAHLAVLGRTLSPLARAGAACAAQVLKEWAGK